MTNKFLVKNPIVTEKAMDLSALGKYIFLVDKKATAPEVKKAIQTIYKINVEKIHIINTRSKPRRWGRKIREKSGYKKAIITLKAGQKLDILPH